MEKHTAPKAILFDWDNTLVDSWPCIHQAFNKAFKAMDKPLWTMDDIKGNVGRSLRDIFPELFGDRWEEAKEIYLNGFAEVHLDMLSPFEGIEDMLKELRKQDIFIGIVSNKTSKFLNKEISHLGWHKYFDVVVGANQAKKDKPAVDPVVMALEKTGITLPCGNDVWFIGDSDVDMKCANEIGSFAVLVRPTPPKENEFAGAKPDMHIKNCAFLPKTMVFKP